MILPKNLCGRVRYDEHTARNDGVPEGIVERCCLCTLRRVGQLSDEHRSGRCRECQAKPDQEPGHETRSISHPIHDAKHSDVALTVHR